MAIMGMNVSSRHGTQDPSRLAWSEGRRPLEAVLYAQYKRSQLSQWVCHDDSAINGGTELLLSATQRSTRLKL